MKLLVDFTQEELAAITPEQKQQLFLLECADRGIALPASVPEYMSSPEDRPDLQPDTTVYAIGSGYSNDYYFSSMDSAKAAADLIAATGISVTYDYGAASSKQYRITDRDSTDVNVTAIQAYSMDKHSELKAELKKFNDQKKLVDSNNERRTQILDKHEALMTEIEAAISDAVRNVNRVSEFAAMFKQYLGMANNDHTVAARFLLNAHYDEVAAYTDGQLETIGISRNDIAVYESANKMEEV